MIDIYCERCGPGLFAEPINAITNLAFLLAALGAWSLARRSNALSSDIWVLIALAVAIGIGSTLFHTFAAGWAQVLDELPILFFQLWFLWLYMRQVMGLRGVVAAGSLAAYLVAAYLGRQFPDVINGSLVYAPAFAALLGLGLYHYRQQKSEPFLLLAATGVFAISLFARSIDQAVCPYFPIGTHFVWHILNGLLLYLSMRGLILNRPGAAMTPIRGPSS